MIFIVLSCTIESTNNVYLYMICSIITLYYSLGAIIMLNKLLHLSLNDIVYVNFGNSLRYEAIK